MCDMCWQSPCDSRCPNAPEPPVFALCRECGEPIYDGDEYYEIEGRCYCEACVLNAYRTAEVEDCGEE